MTWYGNKLEKKSNLLPSECKNLQTEELVNAIVNKEDYQSQ